MSQMSEAFHQIVNGSQLSQGAKDWLNSYGLFVVWGVIIGVPILAILLAM